MHLVLSISFRRTNWFFMTFWNAYITDVWGGILMMKGGVRVGMKRQKQQRLIGLDGGTFNNQLGWTRGGGADDLV